MVRALLITALVFSVASCGRLGLGNASKRGEAERALPFKAKLSKGEERDFSVSVVHKGAGLDQVRESVRFEATKYCLLTFGGSDAEWQISPTSNDWAFTQDGDKLIFNGACSVR